jgi:hypothetical protein
MYIYIYTYTYTYYRCICIYIYIYICVCIHILYISCTYMYISIYVYVHPQALSNSVKHLSCKYGFGSKLRSCTDPDFISRTITGDHDGGGSVRDGMEVDRDEIMEGGGYIYLYSMYMHSIFIYDLYMVYIYDTYVYVYINMYTHMYIYRCRHRGGIQARSR